MVATHTERQREDRSRSSAIRVRQEIEESFGAGNLQAIRELDVGGQAGNRRRGNLSGAGTCAGPAGLDTILIAAG